MAGVLVLLSGCPGDGTFEIQEPDAEVPTSPTTLYAFLEAGGYREFDHESAPHAPAGPHREDVQVYMNRALVASLTAGKGQHPRGSAAVKELYDGAGALAGWAVMVKQRDEQVGTAWYWFETFFDATKGDNPVYAGDGSGSCVPCHSLGRDFIRIEFPLR